MGNHSSNKRKIVNDPVYGFINIPSEKIFDIIEHRYFQRLRRIKQLGLTDYVYPGAVHTRFQHTLGAVHLLNSAIQILRLKNVDISTEEEEAVMLAILMHDIGHGPFSHTLENVIVENLTHEQMSMLYMQQLNKEYSGQLDVAINIFENNYHKKFLHQLVSSQLDVDRLDYLRRDSFYTGVSEGVISSDRIIKMMHVKDGQLVVEAKGIYSIEKFLIARWLMYWQVYLHKTVVSTEQLVLNIFKRVKQLINEGEYVFLSDELEYFLKKRQFGEQVEILEKFSAIDDTDIIFSVKKWQHSSDKVLSELSTRLIQRDLFKIEIQDHPFEAEKIEELKAKAKVQFKYNDDEINYFVFTNHISKNAYSAFDDKIQILYKDGELVDIGEASDMLNTSVLSKTVKKYFLCYPKEIK
ncbi:MAG TPA: HD domain-containing protein [Bacteroidales bacterium]|nr:HD domain-containing protein [Bacteroidales bacterium]